mgnify:CR=1 FL=1
MIEWINKWIFKKNQLINQSINNYIKLTNINEKTQ